MLEQLKSTFHKLFGESCCAHSFFSPGRVNLIGEHIDYNGGHVFPCALTIGTYAVAEKRTDTKINFYSINFKEDGVITKSISNLSYDSNIKWINYPLGVLWAFQKRGFHLPHGFDIVIGGDIPNGSGLSSSASLEVLIGLVIREIFHFDQISMLDLALIGQEAENQFNGMNCGIMDQFASAMGKKDNAIFLNTSTLKYEYAPLLLKDAKLIITNSNVKHSLVQSAYNDRRKECEAALFALQEHLPIKSLGELSIEEFEAYKNAIDDPICQKRAKHAVYENQRTISAMKALKTKDLKTFGNLMNDSHLSLKNDYEVSCPEIDLLVSEAWNIPGVIGSRMTGGGFGGCTVSLVKKDSVPQFTSSLKEIYTNRTSFPIDFYFVDSSDGAHLIKP